MSLLKSIFISQLIPMLIGSTSFIIWQISILFQSSVINSNLLDSRLYGLIGSLLISGPFLLFFINAMLFKNTVRTNPLLPWNVLFSFIGLILILFSELYLNRYSTETIGTSAFYLNIESTSYLGLINIILLVLYIFWYSKLSRPTDNILKKGTPLPAFNLYQYDRIYSSKKLTKKPSIFIFYRGNWCPFCIAQIKELSKAYDSAVHKGIQFVLVSPQPDQYSENIAKAFNMSFLFLRDKDNQAAKKLGILHENGLPFGLQALGYSSDTVMPTVIVTNKNGVIEYLDQTDNYRVRPEINEFLNLFVPK